MEGLILQCVANETHCRNWILSPKFLQRRNRTKQSCQRSPPSNKTSSESMIQFTSAVSPSLPIDWEIFKGNQQYTAYISYQFMLDFLGQAGGSQKCILILDGFLNTNIEHDQTRKDAQFWRIRDQYNRRLVIISWMSSRRNVNDEEDSIYRVREHLVPSWTRREYDEALKIPDLLSSVSSSLGSPPGNSEQGLQELIDRKFYFAGGSARYMFQFATKDIKESLDKALRSVPSKPPESYFMMSARGGNNVNSLVALHPSPSSENNLRET